MIKADRIEEILKDCLYDEPDIEHFSDDHMKGGAIPADGVAAQGIMSSFIFDPKKLDQHRQEITDYLLQLPDNFMQTKGGGWSFLQACVDKNGEQWTGLHQTMDRLFTLGQAIGRVKCLLPREIWGSLPGGMPYYMVVDADLVPASAS